MRDVMKEKAEAKAREKYDLAAELQAEDRADWLERCSYHKPSAEGINVIEDQRTRIQLVGSQMLEELPECDERDTALHYLQQALMWANAAAAYRIAGSEVESGGPTGEASDSPSDESQDEIRRLTAQKDAAYSERNMVVAALSKLFPSSLERHPEGEDWEEDWRWIVFIDLPTGQATWHIHDDELGRFDHLGRHAGRKWDGHTTHQKYERLLGIPGSLSSRRNLEVSESRGLEAYLKDLDAIVGACGLGLHARNCSAHELVHEEVIPRIKEMVKAIHWVPATKAVQGGEVDGGRVE